ncbi:hypothetical protein [Actinophytocola glycyrrhizae]|uniref:Transcriptional regulator n=1 Tax=Actinophytocola glycyrrhizae TaxID=2044873 RepID=A0ABV9RWA4_9PSEU
MFGIDRTPNTLHHSIMGRQDRDAVEALIAGAHSLGIEARLVAGANPNVDAIVVLPSGETVAVEIQSASLVTADSVPGQLRRWSKTAGNDVVPLVVANRITADGRVRLNRAGWSWLDLRGHLRIVGPGLLVDADVPALSKPRPAAHALSGRVGIGLAALLLLDPTTRIGVRAAATMLARAPSSISGAFAALRAADLVHANHLPAVPELFWELAEHWKPASEDVASIPEPGNGRDNSVLRLGLDDVESTVGWALTDTVAAVAYGAPVSMRADHPPDFYVPDQGVLRRAVHLLGPAATPTARACRIRVAPVPLVCARRIDGAAWANEAWPLANPLFVALDLAQDPGRGREILDHWEPGKPWTRVW